MKRSGFKRKSYDKAKPKKERFIPDKTQYNELKSTLVKRYKSTCALSGIQSSSLELHHWLIHRSDIPILRIQDKIHHEYNCILLTKEQHDRDDGSRRDYECAIWAIQQYGKEEIDTWMRGLGLKTFFKSFDQWLAHKESKLNIPEGESLV